MKNRSINNLISNNSVYVSFRSSPLSFRVASNGLCPKSMIYVLNGKSYIFNDNGFFSSLISFYSLRLALLLYYLVINVVPNEGLVNDVFHSWSTMETIHM